MDRRRTARVAGAFALTALLALVVVSAVGALDFADEPCRESDPYWICPSGLVDAPYSMKFEGKSGGGSGPPFSFDLLLGSPPPGLTLQKNGTLSGTPTHAGSSTFWLLLRDSAGNPGGQNEFIVTIEPRVLVTTQTAASGTTGVPYSLALSAVMKSGPTTTAPPFESAGVDAHERPASSGADPGSERWGDLRDADDRRLVSVHRAGR